jgi:hypothetical protein
MSSGPDNVTTTNKTEPPAFLLPGLKTGVAASLEDFFQGPQVGDVTQQGIAALANRGAAGSPVTGAAQDLATQTLRGDFLDFQNNPVFDRLAELTRTKLDTEFAGQGRDVGAKAPARADELGNIAARLFDAERNRQVATSAQSSGLANQDFTDIGAVLDAGGFADSLQDQNIDQLIARITGQAGAAGGTSTGTQPVFKNTGAGILGGALGGASLGSMFGPVGTGIGALGGGLLGAF